jgi:hypothetical protein
VSPNNNEAQIYSRSGDSWDLKQTLSEVSDDRRPPGRLRLGPRCRPCPQSSRILFPERQRPPLTLPARQAHHLHLLGAQHEPHRHLLAGPERLRLDTDCAGMEARAGAPAYQPRGDLRQVESQGGQVRCR